MEPYFKSFASFAEFPSWLQMKVLKTPHLVRFYFKTYQDFFAIKEKDKIDFNDPFWADWKEKINYYLFALHFNDTSRYDPIDERVRKGTYKLGTRPSPSEMQFDMDYPTSLFTLPDHLRTRSYYEALIQEDKFSLVFIPKSIQEETVTWEMLLENPSLIASLHNVTSWRMFADIDRFVRKNGELIRYLPLACLQKLSMDTWKDVLASDISLLYYLPSVNNHQIWEIFMHCQPHVDPVLFVSMFPPWIYLCSTEGDKVYFFTDLQKWGYDHVDLFLMKDRPFYPLLVMIYKKLYQFNLMMLNHQLLPSRTKEMSRSEPSFSIRKKVDEGSFKQQRLSVWKNKSSVARKKDVNFEDILDKIHQCKLA